MTETLQPDGTNLWDEILKAIVDAMPEQLFPLFKEIYQKEYPKGTSIRLLSTEHSTYQENPNIPPGSRLADITLLVGDSDYYHVECQMHNDSNMVIRMIAYDLHFAMQHTASKSGHPGEVILRFPQSMVIYLEKNSRIPDFLRCRLIFQDGHEHIYQIPTVKIQTYSLQSILEKHLNLFLPYVLLRLRPKLKPKNKHQLKKDELTDFVRQVIVILRKERDDGYLSEQQFNDYVTLFRTAAKRVFKYYPNYYKEVECMTKPLIELPSVKEKRLLAELANKDAMIADRDAAIADKDASIAALKGELEWFRRMYNKEES